MATSSPTSLPPPCRRKGVALILLFQRAFLKRPLKLPLLQTKDDGRNAETQGAVRIGEVEASGGPVNGLQVKRVQGSWLDLELSQHQSQQQDHRSARTLQSSIHLDSGVRVCFPKKTLTKFLPTVGTSKVNDNYTNHPTIDAFDLSLGTAEDELDLFVAGGSEGSLYTVDSPPISTPTLRALMPSKRSLRRNDVFSLTKNDERRWDIEARLRLSVNSAKSRLTKKTRSRERWRYPLRALLPSNRVVLSTSSDLTVRIWDPFTGDNPRTLRGHKRAVLTAVS